MTEQEYKDQLKALQEEQKSLNRRKKVDRERCAEINKEFYGLKDAWREEHGDSLMRLLMEGRKHD
jgi:hypothetical protein